MIHLHNNKIKYALNNKWLNWTLALNFSKHRSLNPLQYRIISKLMASISILTFWTSMKQLCNSWIRRYRNYS